MGMLHISGESSPRACIAGVQPKALQAQNANGAPRWGLRTSAAALQKDELHRHKKSACPSVWHFPLWAYCIDYQTAQTRKLGRARPDTVTWARVGVRTKNAS
jgi:hypothetical protein